ncbi:hypothetical protein [Oenococcus kitaharae]|uniref:Uncharacterized protein n=1 Tax=Oenococcus kitaharae DSM 17330 TaxID=1045004 RepID=G9WHN9_9LACO|nr:hypothetical protein [Oenococcus kitaharae]EHN58613.1 hypothetical protein OKIT_0497 [Oenococcus kitaharae DSM 17330]OEY84688.1 hypothetical protein NT95_00945 [Oenococcus kitaharae]OEY84972.1 hypothetical protein NT96_02515 [Oenococcus kitaharae]OEY85762.1 hypothetical protein NV75_02820 [Oenococcus kitaharae]
MATIKDQLNQLGPQGQQVASDIIKQAKQSQEGLVSLDFASGQFPISESDKVAALGDNQNHLFINYVTDREDNQFVKDLQARLNQQVLNEID